MVFCVYGTSGTDVLHSREFRGDFCSFLQNEVIRGQLMHEISDAEKIKRTTYTWGRAIYGGDLGRKVKEYERVC